MASGRLPCQAPVVWQKAAWIAELAELKPIFIELPNELDRAVTREVVLAAPETPQGMFEALVAVYAWGWSTTRVGIKRAARVLEKHPEEVGASLLKARKLLLADGPIAGYSALAHEHRVVGLGQSFGTKFLYFTSAETARVLILDQVVAGWFECNLVRNLPKYRWSRPQYERYMSDMSGWAHELELANDKLEEIVFTNEASRRGLAGWGSPQPGQC